MATWTHAHARSPSPLPGLGQATAAHEGEGPRRSRGGILWIAVGGVLLAGVVFVNVAVLRLNLALDSANRTRAGLRARSPRPVGVVGRARRRASRLGAQALGLVVQPVRERLHQPRDR